MVPYALRQQCGIWKDSFRSTRKLNDLFSVIYVSERVWDRARRDFVGSTGSLDSLLYCLHR